MNERIMPKLVTIKLTPKLHQILQEWAQELHLSLEEIILSVLQHLLEDEDIMIDIFPQVSEELEEEEE